MRPHKILIMGLPGSGKTTLAKVLSPMLNAAHWHADEVRATINSHLGFSAEDRIKHAERMSWLCDNVNRSGINTVADFICPLPEARKAFNANFVIYMDTIKEGRFADTNKMFVPPEIAHWVITTFDAENHAQELVKHLSKNV